VRYCKRQVTPHLGSARRVRPKPGPHCSLGPALASLLLCLLGELEHMDVARHPDPTAKHGYAAAPHPSFSSRRMRRAPLRAHAGRHDGLT